MKSKKIGVTGSYSSMQPVKAVPGSASDINKAKRNAKTSCPTGNQSALNGKKMGNNKIAVPTGDKSKLNSKKISSQPSTASKGSTSAVNMQKRKTTGQSPIPKGDSSKLNSADQSLGTI